MADSRDAARRCAGVLAVAAMVAGVLGVGAVGAAPAGAAVPVIQAASATTELSDAQAVLLTGSGLTVDSFHPIYVSQCVGSVPDQPDGLKGTVTVGGNVLRKTQGLCSGKAAFQKNDNAGVLWRVPTVPGGSFRIRFWVRLGEMAAQVQDTDGTYVDNSISCDEKSTDCRIVVFQGEPEGAEEVTVLKSIPISFAADAQVACGLATDGSVTAAGPVAMQDTLNLWAGESCAKGTADPLLLDYTQAGEQAGLQAFKAGESDVAFSGTGFAPPGGVAVAGTRKAVFTPVAVQGAVIAAQGGYNVRDAVDVDQIGQTPIEDVSMTAAELAVIFGKGTNLSAHSAAEEASVIARNPQVKSAAGWFPGDPVLKANGALATADATTLAMTTAFAQSGSPAWKAGVKQVFPADVNPPSDTVPLSSNFPAFRLQVLGAVLSDGTGYTNGLRLYLTDSATAAKLGLPVVKIQNAAGKFVAPTEASLAAAVKGMTRNPDGTLAPNLKNPDPAAYPLPVVQYAISPAATMADTGRRDRLVSFLRYAVGAGQQAMTGGNFPLPANLKAEAVTSLTKIGATGPPKVTPRTPAPVGTTPPSGLPPASVGTPPGVSDDTGGTVGDTGSTGSTGPGSTAPGSAPGAAAQAPQRLQAARPAAARAVTDSVTIPVFPGLRATALGRAGPALGLVALVALLSLAAFVTSGRSAGPLAAMIRRRVPSRFAHRRS